jgi:hypothetical protein
MHYCFLVILLQQFEFSWWLVAILWLVIIICWWLAAALLFRVKESLFFPPSLFT